MRTFNLTSTSAPVWRAQRTLHVIACVISMRSCRGFDSLRLSLLLLAVYLLSYRLVHRLVHPLGLSASSSTMWRTSTLCTLDNEDLGTFAEYDPLTGYEPNDCHISETTELYIQESSGEKGSLNWHDFEYDDYTIGMTLSSPLFTQEREDSASRRRAYHSLDDGLSSSQSLSVGLARTGRPVHELSSPGSTTNTVNRTPSVVTFSHVSLHS